MTTNERRFITYEEARYIFVTKADLAQMETRLVKWMVGMMFGGMAASAAVALAVQRILGG